MTQAAVGLFDALNIRYEDRAIVSTGDTFDSAGFSPHPNVRKSVHATGGTLDDEKKAAKPWLDTWAGIFGQRYMMCGNHEAWQESTLALEGSDWWEAYGSLLDGWQLYSEATRLKMGKVTIAHGHDLLGSLSKHSAASVLHEYPGQHIVYGHTHRLQGCTTPTTRENEMVAQGAWTVGMMADRRKERQDRMMRKLSDRHQNGFGVIYFFPSGFFKVELCEVFQKGKKYVTHTAGREYTA